MRSKQLELAKRPRRAEGGVQVMYRGPFKEIRDDDGRLFQRGRRTEIPATVVEEFRNGPHSSQFVIFDASSSNGCG